MASSTFFKESSTNSTSNENMLAAYINPQINVIDTEYKKIKASYDDVMQAYEALLTCSNRLSGLKEVDAEKAIRSTYKDNIAIISKFITTLKFYDKTILDSHLANDMSFLEELEKNLEACNLWQNVICKESLNNLQLNNLGVALSRFETVMNKVIAERKSALVVDFHHLTNSGKTPEKPKDRCVLL